MTEWGVFTVVAAIVAFVVALVTPMIKLTKTITTLAVVVENLRVTVDTNKSDNRASHDNIWDKSREHDARLGDHENRIGILEHSNG